MRRSPSWFALLSTLLAGLGGSVAAAQSAAVPAPTASDTPATTPAALAAHPAAPAPAAATDDTLLLRAVSDRTASHITGGMPGYVAQKLAPAPAASADVDAADSDDAEKPKNGIVRLPEYVVRDRPPPVFTQKELLTPDARMKLIFKEHPGLNLWGIMPFSSLNGKVALEMGDEEDRLSNISDLRDDAISAKNGGDKSEGEYIKRETQQTYMHDVWGSNDEGDGK